MVGQRTSGVATIGTVNIVFGATSALIGSLMAFGSNFMPGGPDGRFLMLAGGGTVGVGLLLLISGVGVRRMASWGRSLSVSHGALGVIVYGAALVGAGFDLFFAAALGYCFLLIGLFSRADWKVAFAPRKPDAGTPDSSQDTVARTPEEERQAA